MRILVTGSAGFIGSAFVRSLLGEQQHPDKPYPVLGNTDRIVSLDNLSYSACLDNLSAVEKDPRHRFVKGDICDAALVDSLVKEHKIDGIINFAAESHVDRSIENSEIFARNNVMGTLVLLEAARQHKLRFLQVSTDEVYGSLAEGDGAFHEKSAIAPNSPYSASKAAADHFVRAYVHTHQLEAIITRCSNNYGPFQFPEKFLPLALTRLFDDQAIPVYGDGKNIRDWLHVEDHCYGIYLAYTRGEKDDLFNIGGDGERRNIDMAHSLIEMMGKDPSKHLKFVEDRKGHDWRYAMNAAHAKKKIGWQAFWPLEKGLAHTMDWYRNNEQWWRPKLA